MEIPSEIEMEARSLADTSTKLLQIVEQMKAGTFFLSNFRIGQTIYAFESTSHYDSERQKSIFGYSEVREVVIESFLLRKLGAEDGDLFVEINGSYYAFYCHATREEAEKTRDSLGSTELADLPF